VLSVVNRWEPALLAGLDEIGTWARLLPAAARRSAVPSLDLPHAEAADAVAIRGASYDCMATYGPRATEVLLAAGVERDSIVEIGAPRLDGLVRLVAQRTEAGPERRVVFAAQYVTGAMTAEALATCFDAAVAAAAAFDAAKLVVVPHPAEPPGTAASLVTGRPDIGPSVRLADGGLHVEVTRAALLVTGWSNSVFEAAVAGIPAIAVNPGGVAPVDFGADGLALAAADAESAARVAAALRDEAARSAAVERARRVAAERLGPLDGRAAERAARLMLAVARGEPWRSAA
jgi:glycosyltransferase involved in cell wall biosynthesis